MAQGFVSPWRIAYAKTSGTPEIRLFSFPYARGGNSLFSKWTADRSIYSGTCFGSAQSHGRHSRIKECPRTDVQQLTNSSVTALLPLLGRAGIAEDDGDGVLVGLFGDSPDIAAALESRPLA